MNFSQQHLNPLPRHYQGGSALELAYHFFVDWKEVHAYGELSEFSAVIQAVNHASHWLQADIAEHIKLQATLRAINTAVQAKREWRKVEQRLFTKGYDVYIPPFTSAGSRDYNRRIAALQFSLTSMKTTIRTIKEERYRSPLVEQIYRTLLGDHDLMRADCPTNNLSNLRIHTWALEKLSCAIYLAIDAERSTYLTNMARLFRALKLRLGTLPVGAVSVRWKPFERLLHAHRLLARLVEGGEDADADAEAEYGDGDGNGNDAYLGQIVRYWSRWDRDGYAQKDFKAVCSFVSGRECVVWQR